jgi:Cohesin domain/PEP-CTERM motif
MKLRAWCLVLFVGLFARPLLASPIVSIEPASNSVVAGSSFFLDVNITGVTDLFSFSFDLAYDPALLAVNEIVEGGFLQSAGTFFSAGDPPAGGSVTNIFDVVLGAVSGVDGDGTLARINFTALAAGTSTVSLSNLFMLDSTISGISASTLDGSVTASVPTASPIPEPGTMVLVGTGLLAAWRGRRKLGLGA